jgi:dephospho-CoA kinase
MQQTLGSSKIIGISGQISSGKSTLAKALANALSGQVISFGNFVRTEATKRGVDVGRVALQQFGEKLIREMGAKEFVGRVFDLLAISTPFLILDGVRHIIIWQVIQDLGVKNALIYLDIGEEERFRRLVQRDEIEPAIARQVLTHPMEVNTKELCKYADLVITTNTFIMLPQITQMLSEKGMV